MASREPVKAARAVWALVVSWCATGACAYAQTPASMADMPLPRAAIARLNGGSNPFLCLAFSPDGKWLASGGYERTIHIWDPATGKEIRKWPGPEPNVTSIAFSPDCKLLATGGLHDPVVHLWEAATGHEFQALQGLPRGASSLVFSPSGKVLLAGGYSTGDVYAWEVKTGKLLGELTGPPDGSEELNVQFVNGRRVAPVQFSHVAFAPDGKTFVSGHLRGLIRVWDAASRREIRHFRGPDTDSFVHVAFANDGQTLASWGSTIRVWQTSSWKQVRFFGEQEKLRVACVAFSRNGAMLASGSSAREIGDDAVHIWEIATGLERCRLEGHQYAISAVAFSPTGNTLVSGSLDGTALVWDLGKLPQDAPTGTHLTKMDECWNAIAGNDAGRAYRSMREMVNAPAETAAFLADKLHPQFQAAPAEIQRLIAALDGKQFEQREEATEGLAVQVEFAESTLRKVVKGKPSAEVRARLTLILQQWQGGFYSPWQLRRLRAIEVLEEIGTSEAKAVLQQLATGTSRLRVTRASAAALDRLRAE
jgi:WD40 repeat protein